MSVLHTGHAHNQHCLARYRRLPDPRSPDILARRGITIANEAEAIGQVARFVERVVNSEKRPLKPGRLPDRQRTVELTRLGRAAIDVLPLLGLFRSDHTYPACVTVFLDACWCLEDFLGIDFLAMSDNAARFTHENQSELDALIDKIRMNFHGLRYAQALH